MSHVTFPDSGLHLAVLGVLLERDAVSEDAIRDRLASVEGEEIARIKEAVKRLHAMPLPKAAVSAIEYLDFDGGNDIYMTLEAAIDVDTGGEDDFYQLSSLAGIEALESLASLNLDAYGYREADLDLTPLANHPSLSRLMLSGSCTNAKVLETLPKLTKLSGGELDDKSVLERLEKRGVNAG